MNRMAMQQNVNILHCGCKSELEFINYLEKCVAVHKGQPLQFEYRKYQEQQNKEHVMSTDAQHYKKQKAPLIVLISQTFFDMIWLTVQKKTILPIISNYSNKKCVHVWLDVTDDIVKRRSKSLLRNDGHFRRIYAEKLKSLGDAFVIGKLQEDLYSYAASPFQILNNYAVDDEIEEMKRNFELAHRKSKSSLERDTPKHEQLVKKNSNKDMPRFPIMNDEEFDSIQANSTTISDSIQANSTTKFQQGATASNSTPATKKKKKGGKKMGDTSSIDLFSDLTLDQKKRVAVYLDKGAGANWKQLAQMFRIPASVINSIDGYPQSVSRTEKLIELLNKDLPELEVSEFVQKCKQIMRTDVPAYIRNFISN